MSKEPFVFRVDVKAAAVIAFMLLSFIANSLIAATTYREKVASLEEAFKQQSTVIKELNAQLVDLRVAVGQLQVAIVQNTKERQHVGER